MKTKNFLFIHNPTSMDIGVDDLGFVVKSGKTVNVYSMSPFITPERIKKSISSGSILERIKNKELRIVNRPTNPRPIVLDQIRQSNKPILVRQIKSSIVIEPESVFEEETKETFDFADYNVDLDEISPVKNASVLISKNTNESITVGEPKDRPRSLVAIKNGEDAEDNVYLTDKIIDGVKAKVLDEDGKEADTKTIVTDEDAIIMEVVSKDK